MIIDSCLLTVCFERADNTNAVSGVIAKGAGSTDDPKYWFFGNFGNDVAKCEKSCSLKPNCEAYA